MMSHPAALRKNRPIPKRGIHVPKEPFRYTSLAEAGARAAALGVSLPLSEETALLREPLEVAGYRLHNRLLIQPM